MVAWEVVTTVAGQPGSTHIRLDRESLTAIDNLDCLGPVTNLYLQQVGGYLFVVV